MTIFGFNTDVTHAGTVYHVQSEARQSDLLLQTLVYVKGQCVGKFTVSYAQKLSEPGFSTDAMHELLKAQHRKMLTAIQSGEMEAEIAAGTAIQDVGGSGLSLNCTPPAVEPGSSVTKLRVRLMDSGQPASGAKVLCWATGQEKNSPLSDAVTDAGGEAEVSVPVDHPDVVRESAVMIQADHAGKSATRKFRLKLR